MDEERTIFTIPEVLEVILSYVDKESRKEAAAVCRNFYRTICHLERNKSLKLDKKIMDDGIFQSMLHSSRRFKEITVWATPGEESELSADRIGIVLEKFKAPAELSLWGDFESSGILNKIPDNSLTDLNIDFIQKRPNEDHLQGFVDRQMKLKKLGFPEGMRLVLCDLDLEELTLHVFQFVKLDAAIDNWLAATLRHQPTLRVLRCGTIAEGSVPSIGRSAFNEMQKLRSLEFLRGSFCENLSGQLGNLKELRVIGDASILLQVAFPKLKTFKLIERNDYDEEGETIYEHHTLGPENIIALSRSATNLQNIAIENNRIDYLPAIIENFTKLDSLNLEPLAEDALDFPPPTRENLSLKQLLIYRHIYIHETPDAAIYQTIAMCPNLERISLHHIVFSEREILNLIQSHPRLTHFVFGSENDDPTIFNQHGVDFLDPQLMEIINIFRNSKAFVRLRLKPIAGFEYQLLEHALAEDFGGINAPRGRDVVEHDLTLSKKVKDPFKGFYKKYISNDF